MQECDNVLFVNEADSHSSKWQRREAKLAISMNKKRVATDSPGCKGGLQPELKHDKGLRKSLWKQKDLKESLK